MRRLRSFIFILLIVAGLLALPGCWVMSVYPLYEDDDLQIADPGLVGQWWQPQSDCRLSISVAPKFSSRQEFAVEYSVPEKGAKNGCLIENGEGPVKLRGPLVEIEGHLFLDLLPSEAHEDFQTIPVHSIFRITVRNDELDLVPLRSEFVAAAIRNRQIQGMGVDDAKFDVPTITAPTPELRKFVLAAVDDTAAFPVVDGDHSWHFTKMPAGVTPRTPPQKPACEAEPSAEKVEM